MLSRTSLNCKLRSTHFAACVMLPALQGSRQLFQITADGKRKDGKARTGRSPRHRVIISREEYEAETSVLMTSAHTHEPHRFTEHMHSGDMHRGAAYGREEADTHGFVSMGTGRGSLRDSGSSMGVFLFPTLSMRFDLLLLS